MDIAQAVSLSVDDLIEQLDEHGVTVERMKEDLYNYHCKSRDGEYDAILDDYGMAVLLMGIVWGKKRAAALT